ncbi:MAG TPA: prenyltransferase/squalene oxidase repeat-containing protein, partial [Rhizomicrobium sp.]|nr:prenyltransferase/squalene oxidase repeat-containing protein [Rhizomicrobium sp.]
DWLVAHQQANGGWGESCASYMDIEMAGRGEPTASQTAWALMGLLAVNRAEDREAIERGCQFLLERQVEGSWIEPEYTGAGFPGYGVGQTIKLTDPVLQQRLMQGPELSRAFMLRYNLYRHYFPMTALARAQHMRRRDGDAVLRPSKQQTGLSQPLSQDPELSRAVMLR